MTTLRFTDDFSPAASTDWSDLTGNWTSTGGTYFAQDPNNNPFASTFLPYDFGNSNFELTVTVNALADSGIWLDADGSGRNGIVLVLGGYGYGLGDRGGNAGNSIYWDTVTNGSHSDSPIMSGVFTPGDTYTITVTISGDIYAAYVDPDGSLDSNSTLLTTLTSTTFTSGEVGLYDDQPNTTTASGSGAPTTYSDFALTAETGGVISFSDTFAAGPSADWNNATGNWTTSGGTYFAQDPNNNPFASSFLPFDLSNVNLRLTVTVNDLADGGIWLDADGTGKSGVLLVLGGDNYGQGGRGGNAGNSIYWQTETNGSPDGAGALGEVNGVFTPGDTYTITVTVNGNDYAAYVDPDGTFDANSTLLTSLTASGFFHGEVGLYDDQPNTSHGGSGPPTTFSDFSVQGTEAPCFAEGTGILTDGGPVAVERLRIGDRVVTVDGRRYPVRWIGHRRVDCRRHPRPRDVWPVRVCAHAFGTDAPLRDLMLSPDHAIFTGGVLIPVRYLVNGATVRQQPADAVTYFHVELPEHAVILAEGLPAESYLDTGNRGAFANGGALALAAPDFALSVWDAKACARLAVGGPELAKARARLLARVPALGFAMSDDPGLRLLLDDRDVPVTLHGRTCRIDVTAGAGELRLVSRRFVPADVDPAAHDRRELGVAVAVIALDGAALPLTDARLGRGWQSAEPALRWTAGDAALDVRGVRTVELTLSLAGRYWHAGGEARRPHGVPQEACRHAG